MADINYSDFPDLNAANKEVLADPDNYENWEKLVRQVEDLEGGLHRNSSPQAIDAARDVYNRFLTKFPLFFGFWKKYADLEFSLAGPESATFIYERGVASVACSVDLWTNYCSFVLETSHDNEVQRELFERGAECVGLDFLAHPFWDKYIDFEERLGQSANVFAILSRVIKIPMHQYARYYEKYRAMSAQMPINALASEEVIARLSQDSYRLVQINNGTQADIERDMRSKLDQINFESFKRNQDEVNKRWTYEAEIKRLYFHVTDLDEAQISNWHKYLDFEEAEGDFRRTTFLYERCVVICAHYADFWFRYARWMSTKEDKVEETRNIYERASCYYLPIALPQIRHKWALFEEAQGRPRVAAEIYQGVLLTRPDYPNTVNCLANLTLRTFGVEAAIGIYQHYLKYPEISAATRGMLISALAHLVYQSKNDALRALEVFQAYKSEAADSETFWHYWFDFEQHLAVPEEYLPKYRERVKAVYQDLRASGKVSKVQLNKLTEKYMEWLTERGDILTAAKDYIELESFINGSAQVVPVARAKLGDLIKEEPANHGW
ncbi:hypothetical protein KVT40_002004 [Elsinoe batatas]|uniref:Pre-mRNA-processing factor 39 n=1 Tax=Elsinoe batatas TaxID=2601811 RepID=A0A8K0LA92_9PEZI|nr:hypothetical protein KVT40_002004 [Elsinoe batatas]